MKVREGPAAIASTLGIFGLFPFVALAAAAAFASGVYQEIASGALLAYGATILSFIGGIYWGLAIARAALRAREALSF